jgi:RNA polymerase-binding transcription factor DksA
MNVATARKRLEQIRDGLDRSILVLTGEHEHERVPEYPQDPADAGASLAETERTEAVLALARRHRSEVSDALLRLDKGTYGTCTDCGSAVPEGRLEARPEAARCVACQAKRDRFHR